MKWSRFWAYCVINPWLVCHLVNAGCIHEEVESGLMSQYQIDRVKYRRRIDRQEETAGKLARMILDKVRKDNKNDNRI